MEEDNENASTRLEELDNKIDYLNDQIHVWRNKISVRREQNPSNDQDRASYGS